MKELGQIPREQLNEKVMNLLCFCEGTVILKYAIEIRSQTLSRALCFWSALLLITGFRSGSVFSHSRQQLVSIHDSCVGTSLHCGRKKKTFF